MRNLLACLLLAFTGYLLTQFYSIGLANAYYFQVKNDYERFIENEDTISQGEFSATLDIMNSVLERDPNNPHYWHMKGKLIHWSVYKGINEHSELHTAKDMYLKSLELRQSWPLVWIDLASVNNALFGLNFETEAFIASALKSGPFEYEVLSGVTDIYLSNWSNLEPKQKQHLFESITILGQFGYKFRTLFPLAKQHQQLNTLCSFVKYSKQLENQKSTSSFKKHCL